jgi:acetyl esterase/lipase
MTRLSTRHLVAPELAPALEFFPKFDFSGNVEACRRLLTDTLATAFPPLPAALEAVRCEERRIPGPSGAPDVRVVVYTPPDSPQAARPAVLHIHGGGFVMGDANQMAAADRALALDLGCIVISVDYRLAPETRWPGAVEDCYAALVWMHDNAASLGIDPARIAITGESAGGGHAAALAIHARNMARKNARAPTICLQLLDCAMLDDRTGSSATPHPWCGEFTWTAEMNRFAWGALLGREPGGADVPEAAVPARVADLTGVAPAFLVVGSIDLLLEESLEYARRLTRAGVPVELHVIPGAFHGFGLFADAPQAQLSTRLQRQALVRALGVLEPLPRCTESLAR